MYEKSLNPVAIGSTSVSSANSASIQKSAMLGDATWIIVAAVVAVVLGIVLYFTFLRKKNDGKFKGFLGWMYDFLNFKKLTFEAILKVTYLILALFITLSSFSVITSSFSAFLLILILGNVGLRIMYEFSLIMFLICRNTTEINSKLNKKD